MVKITDPETQQSTAEAVNFTFAARTLPFVDGPRRLPLVSIRTASINLYRSGLCALAQGELGARDPILEATRAKAGVETHEALDALSRAYRMAGQTDLALAAEKRRDTLPGQP